MSPARLLVADGQPLFRRGIAALLAPHTEWHVVGEARDGLELVSQARDLRPDLVLVGLGLSGGGSGLFGVLKLAAPAARIVLLLRPGDERRLPLALRTGAHACLRRDVAAEALVDSLRRVLRGEALGAPAVRVPVPPMQAPPAPIRVLPEAGPALSAREQDVLRHIVRGASNKAIAGALGIAETTVKIHVQHILRKLRVSSRLQAAVAVTSGSVRL